MTINDCYKSSIYRILGQYEKNKKWLWNIKTISNFFITIQGSYRKPDDNGK